MNKNPSPAEIKALRKSVRKLSQAKCAKLIGVSRRGYQKWEYAESPMPEGYWELMRIKVAALKDEEISEPIRDKLVEFVSYYANCPCCGEDETCVAGCTFAHDDPHGYDVMENAREALKETK